MKIALIKDDKAIIVPPESLSTSLIDQFQYELNTFFTGELFHKMTDEQSISFLFSGIATEGGEVVDCYKKDILVKGEVDIPHLTEELGDVLWHISNIATQYNITLADVMIQCMLKFRQRYPERYRRLSDE